MTNFLDYLIKQEIIDHKELKIITYGMNVIIFNFLNIVSIIAISSILGNIFFGVLFLIVFIPIRITSGGYHCKTAFNCFILFNIIYIVFFKFQDYFNFTLLHLILFSVIILLLPVYINNCKLHLKNKNNNIKKNYIILVILFISLIINNPILTNASSTAFLFNSLLLAIAHFFKR